MSIGYKVLLKRNNQLFSSWAYSNMRKEYRENETTTAEPDALKYGYGLFYFNDLDRAEDYLHSILSNNPVYEIWKVEAEDEMQMPRVALIFPNSFVKLTDIENQFTCMTSLNWKMAKSIKPISKIS